MIFRNEMFWFEGWHLLFPLYLFLCCLSVEMSVWRHSFDLIFQPTSLPLFRFPHFSFFAKCLNVNNGIRDSRIHPTTTHELPSSYFLTQDCNEIVINHFAHEISFLKIIPQKSCLCAGVAHSCASNFNSKNLS